MKYSTTALFCLSMVLTTVSADSATDDDIVLEDIPGAAESAAGMTDLLTTESAHQTKVNVVDVGETFYRLTRDTESSDYQRSLTAEARPGDLIEIVIAATNASDETVTDVELVNSVPDGPLKILPDSFHTDANNGLYRLSRNGTDFFPAEASLGADDINYLQWVIFSLAPGDTALFSYRIQINAQ